MTNKAVINEHFSKTAEVWRDKIYKSRKKQGLFEYYDKQYRFDYVVDMIPPAKNNGQRALDMGCGAGQLIPLLVERGYQAYAIDIALPMLNLTRQVCQQYGIKAEVKVGDCENLDYPDNFFDLYVAMGVIEYMDNDVPMLKEIKRVLRPGGIAIVTVRNITSIHVRWREVYRKLLEAKMKNMIRRILGKKTVPYRTISRQHNPRQLRKLLESMSFKFLGQRYAHFHTLPAPLNRLLAGLEAVLGKGMEKCFCKGKVPFLASSYIIKFQKEK